MDDDETETFPTQEEAIAAALEQSSPGDVVEIHDVACPMQVDEPCSCEVLRFTVGEAEA